MVRVGIVGGARMHMHIGTPKIIRAARKQSWRELLAYICLVFVCGSVCKLLHLASCSARCLEKTMREQLATNIPNAESMYLKISATKRLCTMSGFRL